MLKAADALSSAGYRARMVSTRHMPWATTTDCDVRGPRAAAWDWATVDYSRRRSNGTYFWSGARFRGMRAAARAIGAAKCPMPIAVRAYARVHPELVKAAMAEPVDLYYGGTTGALAAVAEAAGRTRVPYALDLEDFHTDEQDGGPSARLDHSLAARIEAKILRAAAFLTASSGAISAAYTEKYDVRPITIHNAFPFPSRVPDFGRRLRDGLRLYWFSQTIGPGRGLEDALHGMGIAGIPGELHLRGRLDPQYGGRLLGLARAAAPNVRIVFHDPASPDSMVELCRTYDVGLALEPGRTSNNAWALSNKVFTYVLAGLAVAITDTPGQREFAATLGAGALLYAPGDVTALAAGFKRWATDARALRTAKETAWNVARQRWHWDHPAHREALLAAVAAVVP